MDDPTMPPPERSTTSGPVAHPPREPLPIDARRDEIAALLRTHPVIIVCGETGSGKTTQLPQILLELAKERSRAQGPGAAPGVLGGGVIAHTQPRRLAARAVAARIAAETGTELGSLVGYQVRFDARADARTRLRLMTDGILLAELADDPWLRRYDAVIVDEAHERSLNVDLLLGALRRIVEKRPELRVVVTSATIDPDRFSRHFAGAPVVEVSGRLHPITIEYRDDDRVDDPAAPEMVVPAVLECLDRLSEGDVLVFLPGEREIADGVDALSGEARARDVDVLTLSARMSADAQDRVLRPSGPRRRVILSTNVAETSLTVPRIRAVVDSGVARLRRYSSRARAERLLVEPISQASAMQRAGRCGRIGPGLCLRLYSEASFAERPAQTTPEVLRSNLAGVVLRMKSSELGDPESFPFIDPPAPRLWQDGVETLVELGAIDRRGSLTQIGRRMAMLPVDPRTSRMLLAAEDAGCLRDLLPIAAALSVQEVSVTAPSAAQRAASGPPRGSAAPSTAPVATPPTAPAVPEPAASTTPLALRVRHPDSDFLTMLRLWNEIATSRQERGSSAFARWCRESQLSPRRVREWIDVHDQLARLVADRWRERGHRSTRGRRGAPPRERTSPAPRTSAGAVVAPQVQESEIHRAILAGFVTQIGRRQDDGLFTAVHGPPFAIHRDSVLARRSPTWIVAAEIVDTGRRAARIVARIQGDWVERVAPHLLRRQHSEPHYLPDSGHVAAWERVTFGAITLVPRRRVPYEPIDPEGARNVFIHAALVEEQLRGGAEFLEHNRALRERLEAAEHKRREQGLLVDVEARFAFYDERVPRRVVNAASFESWRRRAEVKDPEILFMREAHLLRRPVDVSAFPDTLPTAAGELPLRYDHVPGESHDGVTMRVPLTALRAVDADSMEWLIPGMLEQKIEALIRALPKRLRTRFAPAREFAAGAREQFTAAPPGGSVRRALAAYLTRLGGVDVDPADFDLASLPREMHMHFEVVDAHGAVIDAGRDLPALQAKWAALAEASFRERAVAAAGPIEVSGRTAWDFPDLPEHVELGDGTRGYPAIVDNGVSVGVRLFASSDEAREAMRLGLRRLALFELGPAIEHHLTYHPAWPELVGWWERLTAAAAPHDRSAPSGSQQRASIIDRLSGVVVEHAALANPLPRRADEFAQRLSDAAPRLHQSADRMAALALRLLRAAAALDEALAAPSPPDWSEAIDSMRSHVQARPLPVLFDATPDDIALRTESLEADLARWRKLPRGGAERDRAASTLFAPWAHRAAAASAAHPPGTPGHEASLTFAREVERLRIRLFTIGPDIPAAMLERLEAAWRLL